MDDTDCIGATGRVPGRFVDPAIDVERFQVGDFQSLSDLVDEALQIMQAAIVGRLLAVGLHPVQIGLAQLVKGGVVRRNGGRVSHHLVEFGEGRIFVFAELNLLAAGRKVPALSLLAEEGFWLLWHGISLVSCRYRAFDDFMIQEIAKKGTFSAVGMTRFELATSAPPVQRSNQAEPHPVVGRNSLGVGGKSGFRTTNSTETARLSLG